MASAADPAECFGCEMIRTNSGGSSITLDTSSTDLWLHFNADPLAANTKWTNEKHNMYLDSLESSFVRDMYQSMHSSGWGLKRNSQMPISSDQFMVVGHESPENINCETTEPLLDSTADSRVMVESPRSPHFSYSGKISPKTCTDAREHSRFRNNGRYSRGKLSINVGPQDFVCNTAEVSDQNFGEESPGGISSQKGKRWKRAVAYYSKNG